MLDVLDVPVRGAYRLLTWLVTIGQPYLGHSATACAIVVCTALVRLLLHPLSRAAVRGERSRAALMPRLAELRRRHAGDPERLRREVADLQRSTGTTLYAGCLPMLVQLPFFFVLYRLFSAPTVAGEPNTLLAGSLFGTPLGSYWPLFTGTPAYVILALALAVVALISSRWQDRQASEATGRGRLLMRVLPFGTVLSAAVIPLAAGLYLLTTTAWTLAERLLFTR